MAHLGVGAVTKVVEDEGVYQANVACHLKINWNRNHIWVGGGWVGGWGRGGFYLLHPSQLSLLLRLCNFENQIRRDTLEHYHQC